MHRLFSNAENRLNAQRVCL